MIAITAVTYLVAFHLYLLAFAFGRKKLKLQSGKASFFSKIALICLSFAFVGNASLIIMHCIRRQRLPLTNTSETLLTLVGVIVFIFLILEYKKSLPRIMGALASLISFLGLSASLSLAKNPMIPLLPALQSKWLVFHVSSCIVAYCFFTIAFIAAIICLLKRASLTGRVSGIAHRFLCLGFVFLTLGIILGSIWGKSAWGHWWNWDPKEVWALITWLIYAYYFHGRLLGSNSARTFCWVAILGFLSCLFTYLGVNFLLEGLHSYA